jgi:hypothetical protein
MEPISEERCIFSGRWPEKDRWALRDTIEILPLEDDRVCDACFSAAGHWPKKPSVWRAITRPPYGSLVQAGRSINAPQQKRPNGKYGVQHFAITYGRGMTWQNAPEGPP